MPGPSTRRSSRQVSGEDIVVETAWLYYHDGMNQNEIAAHLEVSRATVVNYLQEARERGFVNVRLSPEAFTGHRLATKLCSRFGLRAAYVLPDGAGDAAETTQRVIRGAANWLPGLLSPGDHLGVAWGKTIYDLSELLEPSPVPDLTVIQLVGSMATPYGFSADVCSSNVARKFSAKCLNLHAPAILSTPEIAATLRREATIADQLAAIETCNKSLFAVGSCRADSHVVSSGVATREQLDWYVAHGAVGVVCGRFIDAAGEPVHGELDERIMAVELDRFRGKDMGFLVAAGEDRAVATLAALHGNYATHLVTSADTAQKILELAS